MGIRLMQLNDRHKLFHQRIQHRMILDWVVHFLDHLMDEEWSVVVHYLLAILEGNRRRDIFEIVTITRA